MFAQLLSAALALCLGIQCIDAHPVRCAHTVRTALLASVVHDTYSACALLLAMHFCSSVALRENDAPVLPTLCTAFDFDAPPSANAALVRFVPELSDATQSSLAFNQTSSYIC